MSLKRGTVQSFDGTHAVVASNDYPGIVTLPLLVPFYWRAVLGNLQVGDEVYYMEDDAHAGCIIARTNGEWDNKLRGEFEVTENVTVNGEVTALKSVTVSVDVVSGGISFSGHTHTGNMGLPTSSPV